MRKSTQNLNKAVNSIIRSHTCQQWLQLAILAVGEGEKCTSSLVESEALKRNNIYDVQLTSYHKSYIIIKVLLFLLND